MTTCFSINHLWVIVSDPLENPERFVFVNRTSHKDGKDESCVLVPEDHPFITHKTIISYARAKCASVEQLSAIRDAHEMYLEKPVKDDVLSRIRSGMMKSQHSPRGLKKILEVQGLV